MGLSQKSFKRIQKLFLYRVPMTPLKDWKATLERTHFFQVQSGRITVSSTCPDKDWKLTSARPKKRSLEEQYLSVDMYHEHISILALKDNCPSTFLCSHTVKYYKRHKGIPMVVYADNTLFLPITIFLNLVE